MSVYMEDLDAFTYRRKVGAEGAPVLVPAGSIEQHGRHMPLGVDVMLSRTMAGETAGRIGGVVAAPIVYGYKSQQRSGGGNHLTGTTSLDGGHRHRNRQVADPGARPARSAADRFRQWPL